MPRVLYGGLTEAHEVLLKGFFEYSGYEAYNLPVPDNEALKIGKIYCNKGQCNPTYYTAGNLIRYLWKLHERGENKEDIIKNYFYITAGSCGPCRFGMYELEYRKALREAGFPGFRIIALRQDHALVSHLFEVGFTLKRKDLFNLLRPVILGDLINNIYYQIKPYEVVAGSADLWKNKSLSILYRELKEGLPVKKALKKVKHELEKIEVNYFIPKPRVKITGEFFSQIQEGEANYKLPGWLLEEGAEPVVEQAITWMDYLIWARIRLIKEREFDSPLKALRNIFVINLLRIYIHLTYRYYRYLLKNKADPMKNQKKLAKYAEPYYNPSLAGGEGHMEVGKHIHSIVEKKAHMVISVKPFGCMCSTQSDGVQTRVMEDLGASLFVSVDTSGDAEVNFKSRVLMKLQEVKKTAREEYESTKKKLGLDDKLIQKALARNPGLKKASLRLPRKAVSTAANALYYIGFVRV